MVSNAYTVKRFTMLTQFLKESTEKLKLLNGPGGKLVLDNNAGWTPNM